MKYLLTILLWILSVHLLSGQTESTFNYFNRIYVADTMNMFSIGGMAIENSYLVTGTFNATNDYRAVYLRKLSLEGETIGFYILDEGQEIGAMVTGGSFLKTSDNHFVVVYGKNKIETTADNDLDIVLRKFDEFGNTIWVQKYGEEDLREGPHQVVQTEDNGFFITGFQQVSSQPASYYCVKTDSLGNEEWTNTYQLDGNSVAFNGYQTEDGGYILSGYGLDDETDYDAYLVKIDESGEIEWEQNYGSDDSDTAGIIHVLEDRYLLLSSRSDETNNFFYYLNQDGSIDYQKEFYWSELETLSFFNINPLSYNRYLTTSTYFNENNLATPLMVMFDEDGDTIWTKPYSLDLNQKLLIRDLDPTPDGGYLLTGFHDTPFPQYSWVAKVDSAFNGCVGLSCDSSITVIDSSTFVSQLLPNAAFKIAPNPVEDQAMIQYQLPLEQPYAILRLFDLNGIQRKQIRLHTWQNKAILDVTDLSSGLYTYVVELGQWTVAKGKLIVK